MQERLVGIIRRFPGRRILVVGDAIADQFVYGAISRVSREAPVFILRHEQTETVPGGAANCAKVQTTTKVRILAGHVHSTRQQVIRLDYEGTPLSSEFYEALDNRIRDD